MNRALDAGCLRRPVRLVPAATDTLPRREDQPLPSVGRSSYAVQGLGHEFVTEPDGVLDRSFHHEKELTMTEPHTPAGGAPSAEDVQEHVSQADAAENLGAGNQEPDPATAENPPSDISAGDDKRNQT